MLYPSTRFTQAALFGLVLAVSAASGAQAQSEVAERHDADCLRDPEMALPPALSIATFPTDEATLPTGREADVIRYAAKLQGMTKVCIIGQADKRGPVAHNDALAMRRARAVAARLIGAGVDPAILSLSSRAEAFSDAWPDWFWLSGSRRVDIVPVR